MKLLRYMMVALVDTSCMLVCGCVKKDRVYMLEAGDSDNLIVLDIEIYFT